MLKDPKWDEPPAPHHPSLDGMIDWLETKCPELRYNYSDTEHCLCAQYYRQCTGVEFKDKYNDGDQTAVLLNSRIAAMMVGFEVIGESVYTVRAALRRAYRYKHQLADEIQYTNAGSFGGITN